MSGFFCGLMYEKEGAVNESDIKLVVPSEDLRDAYMDYVDDFKDERNPRSKADAELARTDFAAYVRKTRDEAKGIGIPDGYVPWDTYWLVVDGRIVGESGLRHRLSEALLDWGGHIGYVIRPSDRRKGYGTRMLAMVLDRARAHGIGRVLVTCAVDNVPSATVIGNNGGVLDSESYSPAAGRVTQRYWIDLTAEEAGT